MDRNHRENQATSEFQTRFVERDGGVFFELDQLGGPGTVSLSSGPHKTLEAAQGAATKMVREILRARLQAAGIARCGERPAFDEALYRRGARLLDLMVPPVRHWEAPTVQSEPLEGLVGPGDACGLVDPMEAPALEGEQLCLCGETDGVHMLGANACTVEGCRCEEFTAAPAVEAVQ